MQAVIPGYTKGISPPPQNRTEHVAWTFGIFARRRNSQVSPTAPWSGATPTIKHQDPKALYGIQKRAYIPFTGWRANPVLGAMQEPIPDLSFIIGTHKEIQSNHNLIFKILFISSSNIFLQLQGKYGCKAET